MEFVLLGLLVLSFPIIAIVALVKAVNVNDRLRAMEARFAALDLKVGSLLGAAPVAAPRPAAPPPQPAAPAASAPPETIKAPPEPAPPPETPPKPAPTSVPTASPPPFTPMGQPATAASFEEKFGTRW